VRAGRSGESVGTRSGWDFRAARLYASRICCWVALGEMERMSSGEYGQRKIFAVVIVVARTVINKGVSHTGDLTPSTRLVGLGASRLGIELPADLLKQEEA
jgi:hypothetical protein